MVLNFVISFSLNSQLVSLVSASSFEQLYILMFISCTSTTISSHLEFSTSASCLVKPPLWVLQCPRCLLFTHACLSMPTPLPSRITHLVLSTPYPGAINHHHAPLCSQAPSVPLQPRGPTPQLSLQPVLTLLIIYPTYTPVCILKGKK